MTAADRTALARLATMGPTTCSAFGEELYSSGYQVPQTYARPGGKALWRLEALGYAERVRAERGFAWRITYAGIRANATEPRP